MRASYVATVLGTAIITSLTFAYPTAALTGAGRSHVTAVVSTQASSVRVWVNTASRVYHCPGSRYYGATKRGRYLNEQAARDEGYRAAGGRSCSALMSGGRNDAASQAVGLSAARPTGSSSSVNVWVNTRSGVYHCPGTRYYGATKSGRYMSEGVARGSAYRPAYGRSCG